MKKISAFKIRILSNKLPLEIEKGKEVLHINGCESLNPFRPNVVEADPFLFIKDDNLYLFYESVKWGGEGVIKMMCTRNLKDWSSPVTVLAESCHLSYPFVFSDDETGEVYMIPETSALNEIRVYKATNDNLTEFAYFKTILKDTDSNPDISYSDSSIYKNGDTYFLHTSRLIMGINQLELFTSSSLFGLYEAHPMSPIVRDMKYGRNGGSLFRYQGRLFRPAMNCENGYGDDIGLFEVDKMTKTEYREHKLSDNLIAGSHRYYTDGGHHFNMIKFRDTYVVATDARSWQAFFIRRLIDKLIG